RRIASRSPATAAQNMAHTSVPVPVDQSSGSSLASAAGRVIVGGFAVIARPSSVAVGRLAHRDERQLRHRLVTPPRNYVGRLDLQTKVGFNGSFRLDQDDA